MKMDTRWLKLGLWLKVCIFEGLGLLLTKKKFFAFSAEKILHKEKDAMKAKKNLP